MKCTSKPTYIVGLRLTGRQRRAGKMISTHRKLATARKAAQKYGAKVYARSCGRLQAI